MIIPTRRTYNFEEQNTEFRFYFSHNIMADFEREQGHEVVVMNSWPIELCS